MRPGVAAHAVTGCAAGSQSGASRAQGAFGYILFDARASHEPREKALGGSLQSHRVMFCCFRGMSGHTAGAARVTDLARVYF